MPKKTEQLFGLIEAGGTNIVCAVAAAPDDIRDRVVFATAPPDDALPKITRYFRRASERRGPLRALGVACFGPVDVNQYSKTYGVVADSAKEGWRDVNIVARLRRDLDLPTRIDTDVNCALLAEARYGAGKGLRDLVYITVGTGIGAGLMAGGRVIYGRGHPEAGHMPAPREEDDRAFPGVCPFHQGRCFEGVAAGPAIVQRWGRPAKDLPAEHPGLDLEARYLAALCLNLSLSVAPARIILGGGVMQQTRLFPLIRRHFTQQRQGYSNLTPPLPPADAYIVPSPLQPHTGLIGALSLVRAI